MFASIGIYIRWDRESSILNLDWTMTRPKIASIEGKDKQYPPFFVSAADFSNITYVHEYIEKNKVDRAKLIQYSGHNVMDIIELLLEKGAKVELLLHDPRDLFKHQKEKMNVYQLRKIERFQDKAQYEFKKRENLNIRYYAEPASLRAMKFDKALLSMGWYTYRHRKSDDKPPWLYGHRNAAISVRIDIVNAHDLVKTFDEVFRALWATSIPHEDLEPEIRSITNHFKEDVSKSLKSNIANIQ